MEFPIVLDALKKKKKKIIIRVIDPGSESVYFIFLCHAANGVESRPHPQAVMASILKGDKPAAVQRSMSMKATPQPLPRSPITAEGWLAWWVWHVGGCVTWAWWRGGGERCMLGDVYGEWGGGVLYS